MVGKQLFLPSADRNKDPILSVLRHHLPETGGTALEIGSGTGQHVCYFAQNFPQWTWQPSDYDMKYLSSIPCYVEDLKLPNVRNPFVIDISTSCDKWDDSKFKKETKYDFMLSVNMMHIAPFQCTEGLFKSAGEVLKPSAKLITYGPYMINGILEPQSNINFDMSLKSQNHLWGIRDIRDLKILADQNGLTLTEIIDLPANNKCLIFVKT